MDKRRRYEASDSDEDGDENGDGLVKRHRPDYGSMSHTSFELPASSYTVAWICAIPCELAAARAVLDETHPSLPDQPWHDTNHYTLGAIGRHNVVVACLPASQYGTNNATNVLTNLTRTFPSIRKCLMVGVGGGVPSQANDIRLGDVVVGVRVMPYELSKVGTDGEVQHMGSALMPHPSLSTLLSTVRAKHESELSRVPSILREMFSSHSGYGHPNLPDRLFEASHSHVQCESRSPCDGCDGSRVVPRRTRRSTDPHIHYGAIGSGDKLIKDGLKRDDLAQKLGVMCFEMEAAGLMGVLPCLPVRGICDYSDSHKNKDWQRYAAAAAAAYARELLEIMPVVAREGLRHRPARDLALSDEYEQRVRDRRKQFLSCLQFPQLDARRQHIKKAHAKTCQWLLQTNECQRWHDPLQYNDHRGFLWIRGKPGVGKSTMMKFLHDKSRKSDKRAESLSISFFFNARGHLLEKSVSGMYRSLLLQLLERFTDLQDVLDDIDIETRDQNECPPVDVLKDLFQSAVFRLGKRSLTSFVDALDEGDEQQIIEMVQFFEDIAEQSAEKGIRFRTCLSSRHYPYIDVRYGLRLTMEHQPGHTEDLSDYIRGNLRVKDAQLLADLDDQLVEKSRGVFLWIKLVVDILNAENRRGRLALKKRLAEIPAGLSDLFRDILGRDRNNMEDLFLSISWILFAKRPLSPLEYHHAIWAGLAMKDLADDDVPSTAAEDAEDCAQMCVLSSSKGLAEVTKTKRQVVQFIHESVRDYLIKDRGLNELWPDLGLDWEAQSHESLKQCCIFYLHHRDISRLIREIPGGDFIEVSFKATESLRSEASLLEYAIRHLLSHAEAAAGSIPQGDVLTLFSPSNWARLLNMNEMYKIRQYGPSTTLIYILADRGLANLIRIQIKKEPSHKKEEGGATRYRYPLFATLARGNEDAVAAVLGTDVSSSRYCDVAAAGLQLKEGEWHAQHQQRTPLSWAASEGLSNAISLLLKQGVSVNELDRARATPLAGAIKGGHHTAAQLLIDNGAEVTQEILATGVERAAETGNEPLIKLLAHLGADMNACGQSNLLPRFNYGGEDDSYPLYKAFSLGHERVAEVMVAHGAFLADPSRIDSSILSKCKSHYPSMMRILSRDQKKPDVNIKNQQMLLFLATELGLTFYVRAYLKTGVIDVNWRNQLGETPLFIASRLGWSDIVEALIQNNADIEARARGHVTPISVSSMNGHEDVVRLLLTNGADIKTAKYPLHTAAKYGCQTAVRELIANGIDVNAKDHAEDTPLLLAAAASNDAMVALLLELGADIHAKDKDKQTSLHQACKYNRCNIAKLLVDHGSNVNANDRSGWTPLHVALGEDTVELLLERGAHVDARDRHDRTPLHLAAQKRYWKHVVLLIRAGANVNARDVHQETPLHVASHAANEAVVEELSARKDVNVNAKNLVRQTPLYFACQFGFDRIVNLLIDNGADPNARDDGMAQSCFQIAVSNAHTRIVKILLERGKVDLNNYGRYDIKPLDKACELGSKELVELLLEHGATVDTRDEWVERLLSRARSFGHEEIAKLLTQYSGKAARGLSLREKDS